MAEIELKFALAPAQAARIEALLKRLPHAGQVRRLKLNATYFDTAAGDLRKAGLSLRVRAEDSGCVQTVKHAGGDVRERGEWEQEVGRNAPDLRAGKGGRKVSKAIGTAPLRPMFQVNVARTTVKLSRQRAEFEVSIDRGAIRAGRRSHPVCELEIELKRGDRAALYAVAIDFARRFSLCLETRAKALRGYALAAHTQDAAPVMFSPEVPLEAEQRVGEALKCAGRAYLGQALANLPGAAAGVEEATHQMRIGIRRLRGLLAAAKDVLPPQQRNNVEDRLKALLHVLGPARDWDVLVAGLGTAPDLAHRRTAAHRGLLSRAQRARKAVHARTCAQISNPGQTVKLLEVAAWFEQVENLPGAPGLRRRLDKAAGALLANDFRRFCKRSKRYGELSPPERHKLRIACKNLRYAVELFGPLYGHRAVKRFVGVLKPAQDCLGRLNDVRTAHGLLGPMGGAAAGAALGWMDREAEEEQVKARKRVRRLRNAAPFWS